MPPSVPPSVLRIAAQSPDDILWQSSDGIRTHRSGRHHGPFRTPSGPLSLSPTHLAIADTSRPFIRLFDTDSFTSLPPPSLTLPPDARILALTPARRSRDSRVASALLALSAPPSLHVLSLAGRRLCSIPSPITPARAAFSPDTLYLALALPTGIIAVHDARVGTLIHRARPHLRLPLALAWAGAHHPVSTALDGTLALVRGNSAAVVRACRPPAHVVSLAACPGVAALALSDGAILLYTITDNAISTKPTYSMDIDGIPSALTFTPQARHLVIGQRGGALRVVALPAPAELDVLSATTAPPSEIDEKPRRPCATVRPAQPLGVAVLYARARDNPAHCPACGLTFDARRRLPLVAARCGHVFACAQCLPALRGASCARCRIVGGDWALHHDMLQGLRTKCTTENDEEIDCIGLPLVADQRVSFLQCPELAIAHTPLAYVLLGALDGRPAIVRVAGSARGAGVAARRHVRLTRRLAGCAPALLGVVVAHGHVATVSASPMELLSTIRPSARDNRLALATATARTLADVHRGGVAARAAMWPGVLAVDGGRVVMLEFGMMLEDDGKEDEREESVPGGMAAYLAPERLDGERADDGVEAAMRADVYALAVVVWEVLTGRTAFDGMGFARVVGAVIGRAERPGAVPEWVPTQAREAVSRGWEERPERRPSSEEMVALLESVPCAPEGEVAGGNGSLGVGFGNGGGGTAGLMMNGMH